MNGLHLATSGLLHEVFVNPVPITGIGRLLMLVPLTLMVSIVYKTIRCERLATVPMASLSMCFTIVLLMMLIGGALLLVFRLLA